jgi:hypothetical protein
MYKKYYYNMTRYTYTGWQLHGGIYALYVSKDLE